MQSTPFKDELIRRYDQGMQDPLLRAYYGGSDFFDFGYWLAETRTQQEASQNLVEKLLDFLPERQGMILDVACGMGASTRYLTQYYAPSAIFGINISAQQLAHSRKNAPGCQFRLMDATRLEFEGELFDAVLCVEAAYHFETRLQFLNEAWRVLKPGGYLLLSDMLFSSQPTSPWTWLLPPGENNVLSPYEYQKLCHEVGFQSVTFLDAQEASWRPYQRHVKRWSITKWFYHEIPPLELKKMLNYAHNIQKLPIKHYILLSAQK